LLPRLLNSNLALPCVFLPIGDFLKNFAKTAKNDYGQLYDEILKVLDTIKQCNDILAIKMQTLKDSKKINPINKSEYFE
jgi:hypothetical protein